MKSYVFLETANDDADIVVGVYNDAEYAEKWLTRLADLLTLNTILAMPLA